MVREPATPEQLEELSRGLESLDAECHSMADLIRTLYGSEDAATSRAEELCNNLQRLRWALQRKNAGENGTSHRGTAVAGKYGGQQLEH